MTDARFQLGKCCLNGTGVVKDEAEGVRWYRKASDCKHADAQFYLGLSYYNGAGVAKDSAESMELFRKAADPGLDVAQFNLGVFYMEGNGGSKDAVEAYAWINLGSEYYPKAALVAEDLEKSMSQHQVGDAQRSDGK